MASPTVEVQHLRHRYGTDNGSPYVINDISFEVQPGEFVALLGPSGCGKTTTLRCIAGLERPSSGTIRLDGTPVVEGTRSVPTHRRDIGMVFQDYAVWPHMSVFENVAFPLRMNARAARGNKSERRAKVMDALKTVGLDNLADRDGTQLSGGQQQRLSLARALVREPSVLLLDEPLSNLDAGLRERMRTEIREVQQRVDIATILVTHDQVEALSMATRVILMNNGSIVQTSTPRDLYEHPVDKFAAEFVGTTTFYDGTVVEVDQAPRDESADDTHGDRHVVLQTALGLLHATTLHPTKTSVGDEVSVSIRPESVNTLVNAPDPVRAATGTDGGGDGTSTPHGVNLFKATVRNALYLGSSIDLYVEAGGQLLRAEVSADSGRYSNGDKIWIELPARGVRVIAS